MAQLDIASLIVIALGLSADCLAVSIGISVSVKKFSIPPLLRVAITFGVFQALMTVAGWLIGQSVASYLAQIAGPIAFLLLAFIGFRMIWASIKKQGVPASSDDFTRGLALIILAIASSIDALAAGLSFALLEVSILKASIIIGVIAFAASVLGFVIGNRSGPLLGRRAEAVGGLLLIAIGLRILIASFTS